MDYYQLVDKKSLRGLEVVEGVDHLQNHRPEKTGQDLDQVGWSVRHIQQPKVLILICRKYDEQKKIVRQFDILLFLCKSNLYSLLTFFENYLISSTKIAPCGLVLLLQRIFKSNLKVNISH